MVKGRAIRDVISDEKCNEMRKQRYKKRENEINKPWSHLRAEKEHRSEITKNPILKPRRVETIEGKPTTRKITSMTTKL